MIPSLNSIHSPDYGATSSPRSSHNGSSNDVLSTVLVDNYSRDHNDHVGLRAWKWHWFLLFGLSICGLIVTEVLPAVPLYALKTKFVGIVLSDSPTTPSAEILRLHNPTPSCMCTVDKSSRDGQYCKSLLLLRHAKSSWEGSFFVDDINRHLSKKGIVVAHEVGRTLNRLNVKLPDLILSSPSVRTEETLNIVLGEWILGAEAEKHPKARLHFKSPSEEQNEKLNEKLVENNINIQYSDALYSLSDEGYLHHLVAVLRHISHFNEGDEPIRVLIVGHNPALEDLLNYLSPRRISLEGLTLDTSHRHFAPGQFYEICFPDLRSWGELQQTAVRERTGIVSLLLPFHK